MTLIKEIIKEDIINREKLLDKVINEWNSRYKVNLEKLSNKFKIRIKSSSGSESDSESDYNINEIDKEKVDKLIKQAVKCKAYAETEYQSIKDIRSELEDCQMIKDLGISLRKLEEEKSEQNAKLKALAGKNMELIQEKQYLEKSLQELNMQSKLTMNGKIPIEKLAQSEYIDRKSALSAKLESYTNRTQASKRINKNPEYCHIAPNFNLFSDSELSISEEDSLEKEKSRDGNFTKSNDNQQKSVNIVNSPDKFESGIHQVSKSTPIKENSKSDTGKNNSAHLSAINNLTQDLKDIQKYFDKKEDESVISPTHLLDWEMSQISFDEFRDQNTNGFMLEGKEDPDDDQLATIHGSCRNLCCGDEKLNKNLATVNFNSSQHFVHKIDCDIGKLHTELREEKEKFSNLSNQIAELYALVHGSEKMETNEMPTCSGDRLLNNADIPDNPLEQVEKIKNLISTKFGDEKNVKSSKSFRSRLINKLMSKNSKKSKSQSNKTSENITTSVNSNETPILNSPTQIQCKTKPFSDSRIRIKKDNQIQEPSYSNKRTLKKFPTKPISVLTNGSIKMDKNGAIQHTDRLIEHGINQTEIMIKSYSDDLDANIFKSLSETSVRLLTEIISNINKTNQILINKDADKIQADNKDYTPLVSEYLQYLMAINDMDFRNENCRQHPIYDMLQELQFNAMKITEKQAILNKSNNGLSQTLESFYQEQLNKCYDDIKRLKRQLESTQQLLTSKIPADATQVLFEAKQKLQVELESVDREYARRMARERKRLEESENLYSELLVDHENMQKKYISNINSLKQQIEQLERKIEADRRFIDQQQFEWELERSQHNMDMENLNKSIGRMKKSSSCSDNLSDCVESPKKEKIQKSNSLPKSKQRSFSVDLTEISCSEIATQTIQKDVIILKTHLVFADLENYDEFQDLKEEVMRNFTLLINFIHLLTDLIFDVAERNQLNISLKVLHDFNAQENFHVIFQVDHLQLDCMRKEILNFRDFLNNFINDQVNLKRNFDRIQEELQISATNVILKQDIITSLEEEIQSLMEFQRNLSKDYEVLQIMLEEKQNELDNLSAKLLSQQTIDEYEEIIQNLKKEIIEKQNIIDERDEDLYVLKEDKELMEQDLKSSKEKYEAIIIQHNDIYQDLEIEMKDCQKLNHELQDQINNYLIKLREQNEEISSINEKQSSFIDQISKLTEKNEILIHNNLDLTDETKLTELRLSEMKEQHKLEILKINTSLEESERFNRELMEKTKINQGIFESVSCQTVHNNNNESICRDSLMSCVNIQDKLLTTIDKLKREYIREKELRQQIEMKYKHCATQYETLSNKVILMGNKVHDTRTYTNQECNNDFNQSIESIDINDLLNEESLAEDIEFKKLLHDCSSSIGNENNNEYHQAVACQTESSERLATTTDNNNIILDFGFTSLSEWLPDLLKEVELVLQSCVIGDDLPREVLPKMNKFRNLLEQMYKRQLSILLNKISTIDQELQTQRKTNQELKHKSDFIMNELQEKESIQKNLRMRLDQEMCNNTRLTETNKNQKDQNRSIKTDLSNQIFNLKEELERERNRFSDINRQLRNEQHSREQLEAALSVTNERIKLVEQSNVDLIKKSRQQTDFQQKEMDNFNSEYAEIFRKCNNYKIQIESLHQNLQYQVMECDKTKSELQETIQSNTEYRDKMNEFVKIYQERRKKLETEVNELHQLLQISCRREITFVKETETLRVKCQSTKNMCKDYEKTIKQLEKFIGDLHAKHDEERQSWLSMINGSIDAKDKDDGILSQVNWLLKMLQLRIELLVLHYIPNLSSQGQFGDWDANKEVKSMLKCRPNSADNNMNRNGSELLVLLQSIQSMQSMINLYLTKGQIYPPKNGSCIPDSNYKISLTERNSLNENNMTNRPKPTGSSDSLDSISDTDSVSDHKETFLFHQEIDSITELQCKFDHSEKWRQLLIDQKKYILSQLSQKLCNFIVTPLLTEQQQILIHKNFFRFKFRAVGFAIIAHVRFNKTNHSPTSNITLSSRLNKIGLQLPLPKFSTNIPVNKFSQFPKFFSKTRLQENNNNTNNNDSQYHSLIKSSSENFTNKYSESLATHFKNNLKFSPNETVKELVNSNVGTNHIPTSSYVASNLTPIACTSPIFERHKKGSNKNSSSIIPKSIHKSAGSNIPIASNSNVNSLRKSFPLSISKQKLNNSIERNHSDRPANFSNTLKQIDDFGKRLDKYSDSSNGI